jgi:hypothetical protein
VLGGCAGTLASAPFDVVRTRLVAQGGAGPYHGAAHAAACLWREGGPAALYRGVVPALLASAPQAGLQFAFYSLFASLLPPLPAGREPAISLPEALSCGGLAGLASKAILYPFDVVKKRLQVLHCTAQHSTALHCTGVWLGGAGWPGRHPLLLRPPALLPVGGGDGGRAGPLQGNPPGPHQGRELHFDPLCRYRTWSLI